MSGVRRQAAQHERALRARRNEPVALLLETGKARRKIVLEGF